MPAVTRPTNLDELQPKAHHEALIFDWDGTLADTQHLNFEVLAEACAAQDIPMTWDWFAAHTGLSTPDLVEGAAALAQRQGIDSREVAATRDRLFAEQITEVETISFIEELLRDCLATRKVALGTGGDSNNILPTFKRLNLANTFDAVVTRSDVEAGKPAPDIFLRCSEIMGVSTQDCLVYEDSDEGLQAANSAGMDAVDIRLLREQHLGY